MKICILTQPLRTNYGGLLQAFALQKVLRDMGHDVETDLNGVLRRKSLLKRLIFAVTFVVRRYFFCSKKIVPPRYRLAGFKYRDEDASISAINTQRFIANHIRTTAFFCGSVVPSEAKLAEYDALVVGSDQVWRGAYSKLPSYFLEFTKDIPASKLKRVSYAASFGINNMSEFSATDMKLCGVGAKLFDAISVREDSGVALCRDNFGVEATHVLDPTMLLSADDYIATIEEGDKGRRDNILMTYVLDKSDDKSAIVDRVAQKLNLNPISVMPEQKFSHKLKDPSKAIFPAVSTWLAGFRDAKFVVTDSFHGCVFSIIFNRPFIAIQNSGRGSARFTSLLKIFGLESRMVSSIDDLTDDMISEIDFDRVNKVKTEWIERSMNFLKKGLQ